MSLNEQWREALQVTEIVRLPIKRLITFGTTSLDYILLSPSEIHKQDTVVRKGKLAIDKPAIVLSDHAPSFEGFESEALSSSEIAQLGRFFYMRGISFPSLKYKNEPYELTLFEGSLAQATKSFEQKVHEEERIATAILHGEASSWQFSLIILAACMIDKYVEGDVRAILDKIKKNDQSNFG